MDRQMSDYPHESAGAEALKLAQRYSGQLSIAQKRALHFQAQAHNAHEALRTVRRMAWNGHEDAEIARWIGDWLEDNES